MCGPALASPIGCIPAREWISLWLNFCGIPVSWSAANGDPHAAYFRDEGNHWLHTASGGLLMTCGLSQAGAAGRDEYGAYGLHGQIHHTPARQASYQAEWQGNEYEIRLRAVIEETSIFLDISCV
ncbi:DUF4432 family protein [Paenibacillus rhizoplanae]